MSKETNTYQNKEVKKAYMYPRIPPRHSGRSACICCQDSPVKIAIDLQ